MNPTILLVDIASQGREEWRSFLRSQNCEVYAVEDGKAALRCCPALQPDLVLLYDGLPDTNSFDLCRQLKENSLNHLTPIVIIKALAEPCDVERGREVGAADCWGTPTSLSGALWRIQTALHLKNYVDDLARSVLLSLARSIDAKNPRRTGHSERLVEYAERLGKSAGLTEAHLRDLQMASWLHDIGKVAVPDSILLKPGPLDEEERKIVQQHPVTGEKICMPLKALRPILPAIRHHHERVNGTGYPDGLRGDAIPLTARILQIADIYDALVTDRPYRDALSHEDALSILRQEAKLGWLDSSLVSKFLQISNSYSDGCFPLRSRSMLASYYA